MLIAITHDVDVLIALGANRVSEVRDEHGDLTGYDVYPDVDLSGYAAAAGTVAKAKLKAFAAEKRWRKETSGTVVAGTPIPTDDRAKVLLMGAALSMTDGATAQFVVGNVAATLTGAQFKALYAGLVAHVQSCFDTQTTVLAAIDAGTITTIEQVEAAFA